MESLAEISKFICEKLQPINPFRIILFGSYAYGTPNRDSDIDLLVVTNDDKLPANYNERIEIYLKVSGLLHELNKKYPIDLIVHTKPMYKLFIEMGSLFSEEITQNGLLIYESSNTTMA